MLKLRKNRLLDILYREHAGNDTSEPPACPTGADAFFMRKGIAGSPANGLPGETRDAHNRKEGRLRCTSTRRALMAVAAPVRSHASVSA